MGSELYAGNGVRKRKQERKGGVAVRKILPTNYTN
jgi:hypothetical protein